jgi:hypothetical protein
MAILISKLSVFAILKIVNPFCASLKFTKLRENALVIVFLHPADGRFALLMIRCCADWR